MSDSAFKRLYGQLNRRQREAVDAIQGPVVVLAGPGTGKTSILTLRVANILRRTDTPPSAILALTFTEAGARAMRRKLIEILGPRAYEVRIHTFHSFCNDLIKRFPERFLRIIGAEHTEELEQFGIMRALIDRLPFRHLRPKNNPSHYVRHAINAIRELKRENVSPKEFAVRLRAGKKARGEKEKDTERMNRSRELAKLYREYEEELRRRRLYDFEDMVMEVIRELERSADFKLRLQEEHQYILADEHQDANSAQNRLLELLSDYDDAPNLFVVGDDKQAIFRFQGASLQNFLHLKKRFTRTRSITLEENYRSQPVVLQAAHSVIMKNIASAKTPPLRPRATHAQLSVRVVSARNERSELVYLADELARRLEKGEPASGIAVLVRDNKDAEAVTAALHTRGIVVANHADANVLEHPRIDALRKIFAAVCNPSSDELLAPTLFFDFLKLPPLSVFEALHDRTRNVLHSLVGPQLQKFRERLLSWHRIAKNDGLVESFERVATESGFLMAALSRSDATELFSYYEAFLESAKRLAERDKRAKLEDFLELVLTAESFNSGIFAGDLASREGVQVMTAHKSKGLEFDSVFILFARDGKWGGRRGRELFILPTENITPHSETSTSDVEEEDERRLFYVAMTRARKEVVIICERAGEGGRDRLPSRFVHEIEERLRSHVSFELTPLPAAFPRRRRPLLLRDKAYLNGLFLERGFSVTHLNNFLKCPWRYFFLNLARLPRAKSNSELYGSAIHFALAVHFNAYAREEDRKIAETLALFEHALRRTHLRETDFNAYRVGGRQELKGYLTSRVFPRTVWNEYTIGGVPLPVNGKTVELGGKLDKVELLSDGTVNVVDYKTGVPKTHNEIMGKTKNADGNYYRQLVFYKLLLDGSGKWRMKTGTLDFLRPLPSGAYRREVFEIEGGEVTKLRKIVTDVCSQILSLSFSGKGCAEKNCEYCKLGEVLR